MKRKVSEITFKNKSKRGAFNFVGNAIKPITVSLDEEDAQNYDTAINRPAV